MSTNRTQSLEIECENCGAKDFEVDETSSRYVCKSCGAFSSATQNAFESEQFTGAVYGLRKVKYISQIKPPESKTPNPYRVSELFSWILRYQVDSLVAQKLIPDKEEFVPLVYDIWHRYLQATGECPGPLNDPDVYQLGWGVLFEPDVNPYRMHYSKKKDHDMDKMSSGEEEELSEAEEQNDVETEQTNAANKNLTEGYDEDEEYARGQTSQAATDRNKLTKNFPSDEDEEMENSEDDSSSKFSLPKSYKKMEIQNPGTVNSAADKVSVQSSEDKNSDISSNKKETQKSKSANLKRHLKSLHWRGQAFSSKSPYIHFMECNLAVLYIALRFCKSPHPELLLLSDVIRLVSTGTLPYINITTDIPHKVFKLSDCKIGNFVNRSRPPTLFVLSLKVKLLVRLLDLTDFPKHKFLTMTNMCLRWLNLPCDLSRVSCSFADQWYDLGDENEFKIRRNSVLVPDLYVMAHVLLVLRYIFVFNGKYETKLSSLSRKLNRSLPRDRKVFIVNQWLHQMRITNEAGIKCFEAKTWLDFQKVKDVGSFLDQSEDTEGDFSVRQNVQRTRLKFYKENAPAIIGAPMRELFDEKKDEIGKYDMKSYKFETILPFISPTLYLKSNPNFGNVVDSCMNSLSELMAESSVPQLRSHFDDCENELKYLVRLGGLCLNCEDRSLYDCMVLIESGYIFRKTKKNCRAINFAFSPK